MDPRLLAVALLTTFLAAPVATASPIIDLGDDGDDCTGWVDTNCYHHTSYPWQCTLYLDLPGSEGGCVMYTRW